MATRKAQRIADRLFSGLPKFAPKRGMFSPLPWMLRCALPLFTPRAWQVYTYLMMRAGPEAIVWLSDKQIAHDLAITYRKIGPQLKYLRNLGLLAEGEHEGLRYLFLVDPLHALKKLKTSPKLTATEQRALAAVNDDLDLIGAGETLSPPKDAETDDNVPSQ
jgi:hypothetical protein